jgi:hypothetical protein
MLKPWEEVTSGETGTAWKENKFCSQLNRNSRRYIFYEKSFNKFMGYLKTINKNYGYYTTVWIVLCSEEPPTPDKKISKIKIAIWNFKLYFLVFPPSIKTVKIKLQDITCFFLMWLSSNPNSIHEEIKERFTINFVESWLPFLSENLVFPSAT